MTIDRRSVVAAVAALVLVGVSVGAAFAEQSRSDLTGTWIGTFKCKGFEKGVKIKFQFAPTMRITQSGLSLGMALDYGAGDVDSYGGLMIPDGTTPLTKAQVSVEFCGTNSDVTDGFDELGIVGTTTKSPPDVRASLKGTTVYSDSASDPEAGTCKWSYKRTSSADPNVPVTCAAGLTAAH